MIYEYLRAIQPPDAKVGVACLYCEYRQQDTQTPGTMLASLWPQLQKGSNLEKVPPMIQDLFRMGMKDGTQPDIDQIQSVLRSTIDGLDHAFLLIDALDECSDVAKQETLIDTVMAIAKASNVERRKVSVLVTSRMPDDTYGATLVEIRATNEEIESMVQMRLTKPGSFRRWVRDKVAQRLDIQSKIIVTTVSKADGMFLIADLMLRSLESALNITDLRETLENMPKTLDEYYDAAWSRFSKQEPHLKQLAQHTISWVYLGRRALKIEELRQALAVQSNDKALNSESLIDFQTILEACQGFVVEDENSECARLMHLTVHDYLQDRYNHILDKSSLYVAKTCLTYLCFDIFQQKLAGARHFEFYPFLNYASENWGFHACGDSEISCLELINQFLDAKHSLKNAHMIHPQVFHPSNRARVSQDYKDLFPLRVAVSFQLELTAQKII